MRMSAKAKPLSLFGDTEEDVPLDGYARAHLGDEVDLSTRGAREHADARLASMARHEASGPGWVHVPADVRRAYVELYGRAQPPARKLTHADRAAVRIAIEGVSVFAPADDEEDNDHDETDIDHDAAERAAIEAY